MLAKDLIDRLERLGLLDQEIIEALRQQLEQGGSRVTPEAVAKLLVDNGQLTTFQASKLIGELRSDQYKDPVEEEESDLTAGLDILDEDVAKVSAVEAEAVAVEAMAAEPVEVTAMPVEAMPAEAVGVPAVPAGERPRPARKKPDPQKSVWDSFKIYGYLGIITLLLLLGGGLWFILSRENADAVIDDANTAYDQQNYQAAQDKYLGFIDSFGEEHQYSSLARTRVVMTQLYKAAGFKQEPWQAVDLAKEKLPIIAEEEGMNEERGNLASLLVDIAANLARAAGKAPETERKEELLEKLDEHRELMDNPLYMPSTMRVTLAGQIKAVEEARAIVERDISRNRRLDSSELAMKSALEQKETKQAYDVRKELLRDFPELHDNERLVSQIRLASDIQQTLVKTSAKKPRIEEDPRATQNNSSILLTSLSGKEAPDLRGETLYFRAGGSILAFDGYNGTLKWRRFVGYAKNLPPVRMDEGLGVLLSDSDKLEVLRCDAEDGRIAWRAQIEEPFSQPVAVDDDIYVSTQSGRLMLMDADSGKAKWATQFPQSLEVGPGVDDRLGRLYLPGNHSNLYLVNARDGSCLESFYMEHAEGTISVPPVPLLGHLFVIENRGSDYAMVHVLRVDENGEKLRVGQAPYRLTGNVRVPPIIQGRRLIVLTDRGEVVVYDIEPTAEREQVTVAAKLPPFYDKPTSTQMAVGRTAMWITGTRVGRYELQINTGQVVRDWSLHELDQFIGQPYSNGDTLVHARILRGTSAIRVTAANPKTGEEIWNTDVGVPVAMIRPADGGVHAVTTQASLFELDRESISTGSTKAPLENAGKRSVNIRFENPIPIKGNRVAFLDQGGGENVLIYDPNRESEKLRQVVMQLPSGRPSGGMIYSGGGLFVPLTTGRAVLINWQTGAVVATPFQPDSDPAATVKWTTPVGVPGEDGQVVVADSRKKIYRLRVAEQIRELTSKDLAFEFLGPAVGVGDSYIATTAGPAADFLLGYDFMSLEETFKTLLGGRIVWGPTSSGEYCFVKTDDGKLRAFTADGTAAFTVDLPDGLPAGAPVMVGNNFVLAGKNGWYLVVDPAAGEIVAQEDLGEPVSASPMPVGSGSRLLIPGAEGVIYIVQTPGS